MGCTIMFKSRTVVVLKGRTFMLRGYTFMIKGRTVVLMCRTVIINGLYRYPVVLKGLDII